MIWLSPMASRCAAKALSRAKFTFSLLTPRSSTLFVRCPLLQSDALDFGLVALLLTVFTTLLSLGPALAAFRVTSANPWNWL